MLMTVEELKTFIKTDENDKVLEAKLQALELLIRSYTNNNFQDRDCRRLADIVGGLFVVDALTPFEVGETVQISETKLNKGLFTVKEVTDATFSVLEKVDDESNVLVTKVAYPIDVKLGAVNMLKWDIENRDKIGVQSESLSRHSVTYFNLDGDNSLLGYPKSLCGFMKPYMKCRF